MIEPELARRSRKEHFINLLTQVEFASPSEIRGIARQLERDGDPTKTWHDLREPLTELQIRAEANRCLKCGATVVDENRCIGCGLCTTRCEFDAIRLERDHPEASVMYTVMKYYDTIILLLT